MNKFFTQLFLGIILILSAACSLAEITISEIHYDNAGSDVDEAIELFGAVTSDLSGWQLVLYNGNGGSVYRNIALTGTIESSETCIDGGVKTFFVEGLQNGAPDGIALVDPTGGVIEFISYEGTVTAIDGPAAGLSSADIVVSESSSTPIGFSLQKNLTTGEWQEPSQNTFGACESADEPTPPTPPTSITFIHNIQGSGPEVTTSETVLVEAIVTGDFQNADQLSGFFIQEEDADQDNSALTSEAIFVYCDSCETDVNVGDLVQVTGMPEEFFGNSQINATDAGAINLMAQNQVQPTAEIITMPIALNSQLELTEAVDAFYEKYEGMLVTVSGTSYVSEYFQLGRYGEIVLTNGKRARQFTDYAEPTAEGWLEHQIDLATRTIVLDDGSSQQNPPLTLLPTPTLSNSNFFRGGDTITNVTGPLSFAFSKWRIQPVLESFDYTFNKANPRPQSPHNQLGNLTVASYNVLNYFTTLDQNDNKCGPSLDLDCRGADSLEEFNRQQNKLVSALCKLDADIIGLMELENPNTSMTLTPIETLVEEINLNCPGYTAIITGAVGTDAITVGIIYRSDSVAPVGETAILDSVQFLDPLSTGTDKNRPAIAQTFSHLETGDEITVAVNHLKSKGSSCGEGDDDSATGQGNCNGTRTAAASALVEWLSTNPTQTSSDNLLIMGDLNAYRKEDPIKTIVASGYVDLVDQFVGQSAYSFVFDGQTGYLDHALASETLAQYVVSVEEWHINADEIGLFDYNGENKPDNYLSEIFSPNEFRSSDHDPVIVNLLMEQQITIPQCDGNTATVYVDENGTIVGGALDGRVYRGLLPGTNNADVFVGTDANDRILARSGSDIVCAGAGNDTVIQTWGNAIIYGEDGDDDIAGGLGNDRLFGGLGDDDMAGGLGNDLLDGGEDNDRSIGGFGRDECLNSEFTFGC